MVVEIDPNDDSQFTKIDTGKLDGARQTTQKSAQQMQLDNEDEFKKQFTQNRKPIDTQSTPPVDAEAMNVSRQTQKPADQTDDTIDPDDDEFNPDFDNLLESKDKEEVEAFNKKFNTNFTSKEELEKTLGSGKIGNVNPVEQEERVSNFYNELLSLPDERAIVLEDLKMEAYNNKQDIKSQEVIDRLKQEVEEMGDNNIKYAARSIRADWERQKEKADQKINAHKQTLNQTRAESEKSKKEKLQNAVMEFSKKENFYGLRLKKEELLEGYTNVVKGDFLKQLENDQELAFELYLISKTREEINKKLGNATYGDGVKATMNQIRGEESEAGVRSKKLQESASEHDDYISSWTK